MELKNQQRFYNNKEVHGWYVNVWGVQYITMKTAQGGGMLMVAFILGDDFLQTDPL